MDIVQKTKTLMIATGAAPITWLMLGASLVSVAVILERALLFRSLGADVEDLANVLEDRLRAGAIEEARGILESAGTPEAIVVARGLREARRGADAAAEAMAGATAAQRARLERGLTLLATLGSNAPFVGLLGTVIAIVSAFDALGAAAPPGALMATIGEALVATAVGLGVAIPAAFAFHVFQRRLKLVASNTEALSRILLAHLRGEVV